MVKESLENKTTESSATSQIASAYDAWSKTYESIENRTRDLAATALRAQLLNLRDCAALEIGCGTGINTRYLAEHCRSVVALDFSIGMLGKARQNVLASNVRFVHSDIRKAWELADSSVNLIVCTLVLEHIEDLRHVFSEAKRVLRAGGEFLLYELHPFRQWQGGQAQFKNDSDQTVLVPAFSHSIPEFVNTSIEAGFELVRLDELRDEQDAATNALPRLLSLCVRARTRSSIMSPTALDQSL